MEEVSWGAKVVVILICVAIGVVLVGYDKIFKRKSRSVNQTNQTKQ